MFIHNTTFVVDREIVIPFVEWARTVFIKAAYDSKRFHSVTMARILTQTDPDTVNFAIQMKSSSLESAAEWHNDVATLLKDGMSARLGAGRVLFFTTDMEIIS